jgi:hypothetical protein
MGPGESETVGKSQSVLVVIDPIVRPQVEPISPLWEGVQALRTSQIELIQAAGRRMAALSAGEDMRAIDTCLQQVGAVAVLLRRRG